MSFNNKSTSTPGKLRVEQDIVGPLYRNLSKVTSSHYAITLIGCVDGFKRQHTLLTQAGVSANNIIIVERDYDTYVSLVAHAYYNGYTCHIIHGDFLQVLRDWLVKGTQFAIVDFDGTNAVGDYQFALIDLIGEYYDQIECANIIAALRTGPSGVIHTPLDVCMYINENTRYTSAYHAYSGRSAMGIWILTKSPLPLIHTPHIHQADAIELLRCGVDKDIIGQRYGVDGRTINRWASAARHLWF